MKTIAQIPAARGFDSRSPYEPGPGRPRLLPDRGRRQQANPVIVQAGGWGPGAVSPGVCRLGGPLARRLDRTHVTEPEAPRTGRPEVCPTTEQRHTLRDSRLWLCLWLLAAGLPVAVLGQANYATPYTFTALAGYAHRGTWDGTGSAAQLDYPVGVALDSAGNLYVGDQSSHTIRKVTPAGVVTTLAGSAGNFGSADGTGSAARFYYPGGVAMDTNGNLYVGDWGNHTIRKMTPVGTNWVATTLAGLAGSSGTNDGTGSAAQFNGPDAVAVDSAGNIYVADSANNTIRKVTPAEVVTTLAGRAGSSGSADGTNSAARFNYPMGVALDTAGNLYVGDSGNNTIRKVTPVGTNWVVTTLAGSAGNSGSTDGAGTNALFNFPWAVAVDKRGQRLCGGRKQQHGPQSHAGRGGDDAGRIGIGGQRRLRRRDGDERAVLFSRRRGGGQCGQRLCGGRQQLRHPESDARGRGHDAGRKPLAWQRGRHGDRRAIRPASRAGSGQRGQPLCGG